MSAIDRIAGALAGTAHPRLLVLVVVGAVVGVVGTALAVATPDPTSSFVTLGVRLAVVGYLAFLLGGSGYVAFAVFERGFD